MSKQVRKADKPKYLFLRGNNYYYIRTVPPKHRHKFEKLGETGQIWKSLNTTDYVVAIQRVSVCNISYETAVSGEASLLSNITFEAEVAHAELLGLARKSSSDLRFETIEQSIQSMSERFDILRLLPQPTALDLNAIAGSAKTPGMTITKALEKFFEITPEFLDGLNEYDADQKVKKYRRSINHFIRLVGDIDILDFNAAVASKLLLELKDEVFRKEKYLSEFANRIITHVRVVVRDVLRHSYQRNFIELDGIKVKRDDAGKVPSFLEAEARAVEAALPGSVMSEEAQALVKLALITGAGVKELCWLTADDIVADAQIPFIRIGENALRKRVKCGGARHRELPIVTAEGIEILRKYPNGFAQFQAENGPSKANKEFVPFFQSVTPGKSFTSARHRMDDLVKAAKIDLGVKAAISGHALPGHLGYYGDGSEGYMLQHKKEAFEMALTIGAKKNEEKENERLKKAN